MDIANILQSMKNEKCQVPLKFRVALDSVRTVWQVFETFPSSRPSMRSSNIGDNRWHLFGNTGFRQGLGPHNRQGGAQCMEHHFHKWPWEGQENPPHVGKGPDLIFWQGASQWIPGM